MSTSEVTSNGKVLGWATGPQRDGTWSLTTDNGISLLASATDLDNARSILAGHRADRLGR